MRTHRQAWAAAQGGSSSRRRSYRSSGEQLLFQRDSPAGSQCSRQNNSHSPGVILLLLAAKLSLYALLWCCLSFFECLDFEFCPGITAVREVSVLDTQSQPSEHESLPWHGQEFFKSSFPKFSLPQALLQNSAGAHGGPVQGLSKDDTNQPHMDILQQMLNRLLLFFSNFPLGLWARHILYFPTVVSTGSKCYCCYLQSGKSDP